MAGPVIIKTTFLLRRGSEQEWVTKNPILKYGEPGIAVDTMNFKIGDGETPWNDLDSISGGLAEPIDCVDAGTTPYGVVWNTGEGAVTGTLTTEDAESAFYFVPSSTTGAQAQGQYERSLTGGAIVYFPYGENWFKFTATEFDIREKAVRYLISASGDQYTYEQIASLHNLEIRSVNELPTASIDTLNAIYLVPSASGVTKEEYVTVVDTVLGETVYSWDQIGDTEIDLSGYAHKIVGGTTGNLVAFDNTGDLVDSGSKVSDFQSKIQYVTLEHGSGTLTQAQFDTLFAQGGYADIVYVEEYEQSILERSGVHGVNFYWTCVEEVGNHVQQKQIEINYETKAWEYSVVELEEKIDVVEIDTSALPGNLPQGTYNTLFSSKLNVILDISTYEDFHTKNRVYTYVDDIFDSDNQVLYTRYGCTYMDGTVIKRSIITINRSNRNCSAPVDTAIQQRITSQGILKGTGVEVVTATAGTDYIAPGDSKLIPSGGTTGQFLAKSSNSDYATEWVTYSPVELFNLDYDSETEKFILLEADYERFEGALTAHKTIKFVFNANTIPSELIEIVNDEEEEHYIYKFPHNTAKVERVAVHYEEPTPDGHYLVIDLEAGEKVLWTSELPKVFEVTLNKNNWESKEQVIENEKFFATGYEYIVSPKTTADNVQWLGAEVIASSVDDGEMTFIYDGYDPTNDIVLVITAEKIIINDPEDSSPSAIIYNSTATIGGTVPDQDYVNMDPDFTYNEVLEQIENGYIPFFIGLVHYENNYGTDYTDRIFQGLISLQEDIFEGEPTRYFTDVILDGYFVPLAREENESDAYWGIPDSFPHTWEYTEGE